MSSQSKTMKRKLSALEGPVKLARGAISPQSKLCGRCEGLRLGDALGDIEVPAPTMHSFDVKIADVGQYYRQQSDPDCDLCHLLCSSRVSVDQLKRKPENHEDADELHVFSLSHDLAWVDSSPLRERLWSGHNSLYLAVVPSGFHRNSNHQVMRDHGEQKGFLVIRQEDGLQPGIYAPQIVSPEFDLSLARHWVQYCKRHHKRLCSPTNKATRELLLIDCTSFAVVSAPDQAGYVALSYTWGMSSTETRLSDSASLSESSEIELPSPLPNVITGAISVTTGLGYRYLWVDRYCIDQDSHTKHQQINQMDLIYQNAELTIVAAAGSGPEHGLSGINAYPRSGQRTCTVGRFEIIPTLKHPHITIQSSKWSTRGWTFQEAALSRRNVVFTEDQVYFECNAMNCHETLSSNLDKLHIKDKSKFREVLQVGLFGRTEKQKYGRFDESAQRPAHNLVRFMGLVEQYTARDLTYDMDSLSAFTGIIRKFEVSQTAISQIWGVPFCRGATEKETNESFLDGLGWNHSATVCNEGGRPRRRPGFPSWSWAGWAGEVQYERRSSFGVPRQLTSDVESIFIETVDGLEANVSTHIDLSKDATLQETARPSAIYIRALAVPASAFSYNDSANTPHLEIFQYPARLALSTGPWDVPSFYQSILNAGHRQCIYLGHLLKAVVIMVVEAQDDGWSRVGLIFLDLVWYWDFNKKWKSTINKTNDHRGSMTSANIGEQVKLFKIT